MKTLTLSFCALGGVLCLSSACAAPAKLEPLDVTVGQVLSGGAVFANRAFQFTPEAARALGETAYAFKDNDAPLSFAVAADGELAVLTADAGSGLSRARQLEEQGFVRDAGAAFMPFGKNPADKAAVWRKSVKRGESYSLKGRWFVLAGFDAAGQPKSVVRELTDKERAILAYTKGKPSETELPRDILENLPDYVVFVPEMSRSRRDKTLPPTTQRGDSYNDHFQVIWDEARSTYFAFWTQASWESAPDQHIAFSKSSDGGKTWTKPVVLAGSENRAFPKLVASWQQPMLAKSGRLYCLWNQQTSSRRPHSGDCFGMYSDDAGETWSPPKQVLIPRVDQDDSDPTVPPSWCNWQRPLRLGAGGRFFVGCSHHGKAAYDERGKTKIEFWQYENIDENPNVEDIRVSIFNTNRDALTADQVDGEGDPIFTKGGCVLEEVAPMKLPDGRLFGVMRSSTGYLIWSQSRDEGRTWEKPRILRDENGKPFLHPCSPDPFYDWKGPEAASGYYFGLVHNKFDFNGDRAYQDRGPLYIVTGRFDPTGAQPVKFTPATRLFAPRKHGNSFYASYTVANGKGILWFNDHKHFLLGREIGPEWFDR